VLELPDAAILPPLLSGSSGDAFRKPLSFSYLLKRHFDSTPAIPHRWVLQSGECIELPLLVCQWTSFAGKEGLAMWSRITINIGMWHFIREKGSFIPQKQLCFFFRRPKRQGALSICNRISAGITPLMLVRSSYVSLEEGKGFTGSGKPYPEV
jgi:hypothetical protein